MGQIAYPAEIFDESIGYKKNRACFPRGTPGHSIDMSRVELPMMFNLHHPLNLEVIGAEAQHDNMQSAAYRVIWGFLRNARHPKCASVSLIRKRAAEVSVCCPTSSIKCRIPTKGLSRRCPGQKNC